MTNAKNNPPGVILMVPKDIYKGPFYLVIAGKEGRGMDPKLLDENPFRGHWIITHDQYSSGSGTVLIRAPFFRDAPYFLSRASVPSPSPPRHGPVEGMKTTRPHQQPAPPMSPTFLEFVPIDHRKLVITWVDQVTVPAAGDRPDTLLNQERMGQTIRGALSAVDSLETLECFPGTALATFRSFELAQKAAKDLEKLDSIVVRSWTNDGGTLKKPSVMTAETKKTEEQAKDEAPQVAAAYGQQPSSSHRGRQLNADSRSNTFPKSVDT
ncbi:hypothetical protein B0T22DRAFT_438505 [Podospora appendiculata]|uniref:Uncharacterized protein n=1 Tax=Podospora appendiculata TaxID=314037 RepID=A0AAE0XL64_9PEZI|nr:hypothetical protein B0T22DRAFT_438505 [Podospora appendiculata]